MEGLITDVLELVSKGSAIALGVWLAYPKAKSQRRDEALPWTKRPELGAPRRRIK